MRFTKLTVLSLTATSLFAFNAFAAGSNYPAYLHDDMVRICEAVQDNNSSKFKRLVKSTGLTYKVLDKGLKCNGQSLMDFAISNKSEQAALVLAKRTNRNKDVVLAMLDSQQGNTVSSD